MTSGNIIIIYAVIIFYKTRLWLSFNNHGIIQRYYPPFKIMSNLIPIIFIVPARIQPKRLQILQSNALKNNYVVNQSFTNEVTHILTEFETVEQVMRSLNLKELPKNVLILNCQWLIDSVKCGHAIEDKISLKKYKRRLEKSPSDQESSSKNTNKLILNEIPSYICQRKCVLDHKNHRLVNALEILVLHAELRDDELDHDYSRALAFQKAISVLKSLSFEISKVEELEKVPDIGPHSLRVIKEILEDNRCEEVEKIKHSEWFNSMKSLTAVYGIGPITAKKLYDSGLRCISDLQENQTLTLKGEDRISFGLAFYEDLTGAVTLVEAELMKTIISQEAKQIDNEIEITLTGGFRRGKPVGHDIDFLFHHPIEGREVGFLVKLLARLSESKFILHNTYKKKSDENKHDAKSTLDHFEQALLILKLPPKELLTLDPHPCEFSYENLRKISLDPSRKWKAIRVDLVVCPTSQYAYALLGWTGNKMFNRSLRNYAKKRQNKRLTSHGLWDYSTQKHIRACNEQEIFQHLKLQYFEPWERNS